MDRLTSLTVFARVVEAGAFAAAARRLGMSTTAVSSHVRALEERLGARLLNRTTRRLGLTEVGRAYYERCTQVLADLEEADRVAGALQSTPRGTLRLYVGAHVIRFVAPVIADYLRRHPLVSVDLAIGERMIDMVDEGFDLVVRPVPPPDSTLIVRRLAGWRHVLCCAPFYLDAHPAPRRPADLAAHNCLRYAYYPFGDEWRFTDPGGATAAVRVAGNLVTNSAEALRVACLAGLGLFLAPGFYVAEDLRLGRLVPLLEGFVPVEFALNAIYPHRHHLSLKVRSFVDLIAAHFARGQEGWIPPAVALG